MSFDRLAPHYPWMETVLAGGRLQRARTRWLDHLKGCEHLLVAGCGHGPFLRAAAQHWPELAITAVDASAGMLVHARRAVAGIPGDPARFQFIQAGLPAWRPAAGKFDALATHFFFDCFPPDELARVIAVLAEGAQPAARWLVSDFRVPATGWRRQRARAVHALMYAFFRPVTGIRARRVTPPDAALRRHGFHRWQHACFEAGLVHADLWGRDDPSVRG